MGDVRLKRIATVVGNYDAAEAMFGSKSKEDIAKMLEIAAEGKQRYYETGKYDTIDMFANVTLPLSNDLNPNLRAGLEYYLIKQGTAVNPNYSSRYPAIGLLIDPARVFTGQAKYLTVPSLIIAGEKAATREMDRKVYELTGSEKEWFEIKGATHSALYDDDKYVDQAIDKIDEFFTKHSAN